MIDDSDVCVAAPFFRKEFRVSDSGRLVSAVVCLCELGCSDLYLNGKSANPIRVQRKYPVLSVRRGLGGELDFRFRCKYRRDFPRIRGFPAGGTRLRMRMGGATFRSCGRRRRCSGAGPIRNVSASWAGGSGMRSTNGFSIRSPVTEAIRPMRWRSMPDWSRRVSRSW